MGNQVSGAVDAALWSSAAWFHIVLKLLAGSYHVFLTLREDFGIATP
jgi:hypothetical protein